MKSRMKRCPGCKVAKPISEFYYSNTTKDKCSIYCKQCKKHRNSVYRKRPEIIDRDRKRLREYGFKNKEWINEKRKIRQKKLKHEVFKAYGGKCMNKTHLNPITNIDLLTIDHINNDGYKEKRSGVKLYWLLKEKKYPKKEYQLLCWNCNYYKHLHKYLPNYKEMYGK